MNTTETAIQHGGCWLTWVPGLGVMFLFCAPSADALQEAESRLGLNFVRFGGAAVNTDWDEVDEVMPDLLDLGCRTIRQVAGADVSWWEIYQGGAYDDPASYDFTNPDQSIRNVYGIAMVPTLFQIGGDMAVGAGAPDATRLYTPDGEILDVNVAVVEAKVRGYVRVTAERYLGEVRYWEIANEVAAYGSYSAALYADLLAVCADELKAVDPDNQVVLGGIAGTVDQVFYNHTDWLEDVIVAGGSSAIDVYNCHHYDSWELLYSAMAYLNAMLASYGEDNKPMWVTELGSSYLPSSNPPHSPNGSQEEQAADVFRKFSVAAGQGADALYWHTWFSSSEAPNYTWSGFGLRKSAGDPVLSYASYGLYASKLADVEACTALSAGAGGLWVYRFDITTGTGVVRRWVAWCDDATGTATYDLTEATSSVVTVTEVVPDAAGNQAISEMDPGALPLTPYPILIEAGCQDPEAYGSGKLTSLGTEAVLGWYGTASLTANDFELIAACGIPNQYAMVFHGDNRASIALFGGTLLVAPPLVRMGVVVLDANGNVSQGVPVVPAMVGTSWCFQTWFRDPAHPDGTGVGLTNGVEVFFCL
ncbi:MAG: hypothetical protein CMJ87_08865 [Planctomycetes bacterium]|nr:hypothetical protein [Planctomycetota bacterium]